MRERPTNYRNNNPLDGDWRQRSLRIDGEVATYQSVCKPEAPASTSDTTDKHRCASLLRVLPFRLIDDDA